MGASDEESQQHDSPSDNSDDQPGASPLVGHLSERLSSKDADSQNEDDYSSEASDDSEKSPVAVTEMDYYHRRKWKRLRKNYKDAYLELFNHTFGDWPRNSDDFYTDEFEDSQIGAVIWTGEEKSQLFRALSMHGHRDLLQLSTRIGTKSQVEVKAYIDLLHEAFVDRQTFEQHTKSVSQAEIAAAVEVGSDVENKLESAADALQAVQEEYDFATGQQRTENRWLIDRNVAKSLEEEADTNQDNIDDTDTNNQSTEHGEHSLYSGFDLFRLPTWLNLSEVVFMNKSPGSMHDDWTILAEEGQRPSVTIEVVQDFRNLAVSLTQRIMQVAIFLAKSRIRSMMYSNRSIAQVVSNADVHAALDILNMEHDAWEFWVRLPSRNKLDVFLDSPKSSERSRHFISCSQAEDLLSQMSMRRMSRSRSHSRSRPRARSPRAMPESVEPDLSILGHQNPQQQSTEGNAEQDMSSSEMNSDSEGSGDDNQDVETEISTDSELSGRQLHSPAISREKRRLLLEEEQDEYMERLDQKTRRMHEKELSQILGKPVAVNIKQEDDEDIGIRPKTLRKTKEELNGWSCLYEPEWEQRQRLQTRQRRPAEEPQLSQ